LLVAALTVALSAVLAPAAAEDIGEPLKIAAPSGPVHYRYFETRGNAHLPGAYWNPCSTIRYGIDTTQAVRKGLNAKWEVARWKSVMATVSSISGLRFRYAGSIRTRSKGRHPAAVNGVDIPITYGTDRRSGRYAYGRVLRGTVAGVAGVTWRTSALPRRKQIYGGYVVIDAPDVASQTSAVTQPYDPRPADQREPDPARSLYLHEFAHALGMEHVKDESQLMYPELSAERPDVYGTGDQAGLRKLGKQRCF
jgi:hypothetical protein